MPITKKRKGEEGRGWTNVLIKILLNTFTRHQIRDSKKRAGYESRTYHCFLSFILPTAYLLSTVLHFWLFREIKNGLILTTK